MKKTHLLITKKRGSLARKALKGFIGAGVLTLTLFSCKKKDDAPAGITKVNHVVVIYLENHSFDNLYGQLAGANGLSNATAANITQLDSYSHAYTYLPPVSGTTAFPTNLPNNYFNIDQYVPSDVLIPDVLHRYYQEQMQIDGGKMDKFALYNTSAGLAMGYYKTSTLPMLAMAQKYTICDNFSTAHSVVHSSTTNG